MTIVDLYANPAKGSPLFNWDQVQKANYNASTTLNYPSPFLNYESTKIPDSYKGLCRLLCHGFLTDTNINPIIENMSAYPITDFTYDDEVPEEMRLKWDDILYQLDVRGHDLELGLDHFLYGQAASSPYTPFQRHLVCSRCKLDHNLELPGNNWKWENMTFKVSCRRCKSWLKAERVYDEPIRGSRALKKIGLTRWNIFDIDIDKHDFSTTRRVVYTIPAHVRKRVIKGDKAYINEMPLAFIEAIQAHFNGTGKLQLQFDPDMIRLIQRPMPSMPDNQLAGVGLPLAIAALREIFFKNTIRRAQAVILNENIIPFRVISPAQTNIDPVVQDNAAWKKNFDENLQAWRLNPQHMMTSGIPVNMQQMGGDGKAMSMWAETTVVDGSITKSLNGPKGLVDGEVTYSGGSVQLKMMENILMTYVRKTEDVNNWIIKQVADILMIKAVKVKFVPFKMGDDQQNKLFLDGLNQRGLLSAKSLLKVAGFESSAERKQVAEEVMEFQAMQQVAQARGQLKAQKQIEYLQNTSPTVFNNTQALIPPADVEQIAMQLKGMNPDILQKTMESISGQNPLLAKQLGNQLETSPAGVMDFYQKLQGAPPQAAEQIIRDMQQHAPVKFDLLSAFAPLMNPFNAGGQTTPKPDKRPPPVQKPPMRNFIR